MTGFSDGVEERLSDIVNDVADYIRANYLEWDEVGQLADILRHLSVAGELAGEVGVEHE